jgi:hypothetical protein
MAAIFSFKSTCNRPDADANAGVHYTDGTPVSNFSVFPRCVCSDVGTIKRKHLKQRTEWEDSLRHVELLCDAITESHKARPYVVIHPRGMRARACMHACLCVHSLHRRRQEARCGGHGGAGTQTPRVGAQPTQ